MAGVRLVVAGTIAAFWICAAVAADDDALLKKAQQIFQPLPRDMRTAGTPVTKERLTLGRLLFVDPRITVDGNVSCATCHQPALFGTDGGRHRLA
jgi:cytochrome c peroxidase